MPKYDPQIKELTEICNKVLDAKNPYGLSEQQIEDFRKVTNTLFYILDDAWMPKIKRNSRTDMTRDYVPSRGEAGDPDRHYVWIHLSQIRETAELNRNLTESQIQDKVEIMLITSTVDTFIRNYKGLAVGLTNIEVNPTYKKRVQEFCHRLAERPGKVCLDARIDNSSEYVGKDLNSDPQFTELLRSSHAAEPTHYFDAFSEILNKAWRVRFINDDGASGLCRDAKPGETLGEPAHSDDHFRLIHQYLTSFQSLEPNDFLNSYEKTDPQNRVYFLEFLNSQHKELLAKFDIATLIKRNPSLALDLAIRLNKLDWLNLCLANEANHLLLSRTDSLSKTPIEFAAENGLWDCVDAIVMHKPLDTDNKAHYSRALLLASKANKKTLVKKLIKSLADVSAVEEATGYTPFHYALLFDTVAEGSEGNEEKKEEKKGERKEEKEEKGNTIKELLVKEGANLNYMHPSKPSPLLMAAESTSISDKTFEWLIEQPTINLNQVDRLDQNVLTKIARKGNLKIARTLVEKRVEVSLVALNTSAEAGHFDIFFMLLEKVGYNLTNPDHLIKIANMRFAEGNTLFHLFAKFNKPDYFQLFQGDSRVRDVVLKVIETKNTAGHTPISTAGYNEHLICVKQIAALWPWPEVSQRGQYGNALYYMAKSNKWAEIPDLLDTLLRTRCDLTVHENGFSALHCAIFQNNIRVAQQLLDAGANINLETVCPPLVAAITDKRVTAATFEWLLRQKNIDLEHRYDRGGHKKTLLELACSTNKTGVPAEDKVAFEKMQILVCESRKNAVKNAAIHGHFEIFRFMCQDNLPRINYLREEKFGRDNDTLLHLAIFHGEEKEFIQKLLDAGHDIHLATLNEHKNTPLYIAHQKRSWSTITCIARHQVSHSRLLPDMTNYNRILISAAEEKQWEALRALLEIKGINPNAHTTAPYSYGPLHHVVLANETGAMKLLLSAGSLINFYDRENPIASTPLMTATAKIVNEETFKFLCDQKDIDVNAADHQGKTALMMLTTLHNEKEANDTALNKAAVLLAHPELLIEAKDTDGKTAVMLAAESGNIALLHLLLRADKTWPTYRFNKNETLFHVATRFKPLESMGLIIAMIGQEHKEFDLDSRNSEGETALFAAAQAGETEKIKFFLFSLKGRMDIQARRIPGDGKSASVIAYENGRFEVARLLAIAAADYLVNLNPRDSKFNEDALNQGIEDCNNALWSVDQPETILELCAGISKLIEAGITHGKKINPRPAIKAFLSALTVAIESKNETLINELLTKYNFIHTLNSTRGLTAERCLPTLSADFQSFLEDAFATLKAAAAPKKDLDPGLYKTIKDTMAPLLIYNSPDGSTVLHLAARDNHPEWITHLLPLEAKELDIENKAGETPLFLAASTNNKEVMRFLINDSGVKSLSIKNQKKLAPTLLEAAKRKDWAHVETLLSLGVGLDANDSDKKNALDYAMAAEQSALIEKMLPLVPDTLLREIEYKGERVSSEQKDIRHIKYTNDDTLLHLAARHPEPHWVSRLLALGYSRTAENKDRLTPTDIACQPPRPRWDTVRVLLNYPSEAKEEAHYESVLLEAVKEKQWDIVEKITEFGPIDGRVHEELLQRIINHSAPDALLKKLIPQISPPRLNWNVDLFTYAKEQKWEHALAALIMGAKLTHSPDGHNAFDYAILKPASGGAYSPIQSLVIEKLLALQPISKLVIQKMRDLPRGETNSAGLAWLADYQKRGSVTLSSEEIQKYHDALYVAASTGNREQVIVLLRQPQIDPEHKMQDLPSGHETKATAAEATGKKEISEIIKLHALFIRLIKDKLHPKEKFDLLKNTRLRNAVIQNIKLTYPPEEIKLIESVMNEIDKKLTTTTTFFSSSSSSGPKPSAQIKTEIEHQLKIREQAFKLANCCDKLSLGKSIAQKAYHEFMVLFSSPTLSPADKTQLLEQAKKLSLFASKDIKNLLLKVNVVMGPDLKR